MATAKEGTVLRLNGGRAVFATVPQSERMTHYRLPDAARSKESIAEAFKQGILRGDISVGIFDDEGEKGRFAGRDVILADGAVAKSQGSCGIRLWGLLRFAESGTDGGATAQPEDVPDQ